MQKLLSLILLVLTTLLISCGGTSPRYAATHPNAGSQTKPAPKPSKENPKQEQAQAQSQNTGEAKPVIAGKVYERGEASWYGKPYHGRITASGAKYNMNELTAAHKTLPFGTKVRVKNMYNGKYVDVTITDRGPFAKGRIIDLSKKAAQKIDMLNGGVAQVELRILK